MNKEFLNESLNCESIISGEDVANMLGMGDTYRKGKEEIANDVKVMENIKRNFANFSERINKVDF